MESKPAQIRSVPACFFWENLFGNEANLLSAPRLEKREGSFSRTVLFAKRFVFTGTGFCVIFGF